MAEVIYLEIADNMRAAVSMFKPRDRSKNLMENIGAQRLSEAAVWNDETVACQGMAERHHPRLDVALSQVDCIGQS